MHGTATAPRTVIALLQKIPVPKAAKYFVFVSGCGIIGKIVVSIVHTRSSHPRCAGRTVDYGST